MGLILWIDQNTFASGLIERAFKKKGLPFYTLETVENFSYLVDDLNPVLIVLDGQTYARNSEAFLEQYLASEKMQRLPFLLVEPEGDYSFIKNKVGELRRPLDPFALPEAISKIYSGHDHN